MSTRRLYYDDSFLRTFEAQVTHCEPVVADHSPAWAVTLDQTAFYPTSGGQPFDIGKLGETPVFDVRDDGSEIVHIVPQPIESRRIFGCVDWKRRFDHMQQHSGQHLLSAILQERFGLPTVSFHLGSILSSIDLRGAEPSEAVLEGAERAANQIIFEDRPVFTRYGTAEDLAERGVRKQVAREGILRAIEIEGIDLQPCGGTHVNRTGQIGMLLLRGCSRIRQDWRLEFVCGGRAEQVARADRSVVCRAADLLKCAEAEVADSVARVLAERDSQFKTLRTTSERLAGAEAHILLEETSPGPDGLRVIASVLEGIEPVYLATFARQLVQSEKTVALLARKECGHLAFAQHASVGKDMNALLRATVEKFGGKGGGTRDSARGGLAKLESAREAIEWAKRELSKS